MKKLQAPAPPVKAIGAPIVHGEAEAAPFIERWLNEQRVTLLRHLSVCESPIETVFVLAMLSANDKDGALLRLVEPTTHGVHADEAHGHHLAFGRAGSFFAQREVDLGRRSVRIDFVLVTDKLRIAVELDDHEFHASKSKRSADAARDLDLTKRGWTPVRFTGSDIWRDADGCTSRVLDLAGFKVERGETTRPAKVERWAPSTEQNKAAAARAAEVLATIMNHDPGATPRPCKTTKGSR